jgi:hypothetical protein
MSSANDRDSREEKDWRRQQLARESERRMRLSVPAVAGGILYLLSGVITSSALRGVPSVGVLQGVAPALRGEANPPISPRAAEVKFQSHHAFDLLASSVLVAIAYTALVLVLVFVFGATRLRRPETGPVARVLILGGGTAVAVLSILTQIILALETHKFATGHDFSDSGVEAVVHNGAFTVFAYLTPLAGLALAAGMIITMVVSVRVGLLPRWLAMVGGVSAVLLLLPVEILDVVPAFWLVAVGILLGGRWPNGDPPAWARGEAVPWPAPGEREGDRKAGRSRGRADTPRGGSGSKGEDVAPEPAQPVLSTGTKRRRKRK